MQIRSGRTCLFTSIAIMLAIENTRQTHGKLLSKPNVSSLMNSLATLNSLSLFSGQGQTSANRSRIVERWTNHWGLFRRRVKPPRRVCSSEDDTMDGLMRISWKEEEIHRGSTKLPQLQRWVNHFLRSVLVLGRKLDNYMIFNGIHLFSRNEDFGETHQKSHFLLILAI